MPFMWIDHKRCIHTDKSWATPLFFSETLEIKYFEFYCKFYYIYEHLELNMISSTKYLDNLRPFTKQVKNDKEKQWKKS